MKLKKVKILGFKSFADKTALEFGQGITAVVGPNGCGKSNISDAFRWVLGEQSAKSMRGSKMPDIIFAGTNKRAPLNFAEVTITLSDIDGKLPIDYDELSVTRRLHRSGESQYFINNHLVRLKDIQSLFLDSGIGKDAFAIFEQGKIDQVINYSPIERRYIFEEAAGILRFLQRKKEALKKLDEAQLNTARVKDIHQEVEKQIIVLEKQAQQAHIYKENKSKYEVFEKGLLIAKWDNLQKRCQEASKKAHDYESQKLKKTQEIEIFQSQLFKCKEQLSSTEKGLRTKHEEVFRTRSQKEIKSKEQQTNQERLKELLLKDRRWQQELESMIEKREHRHSERVSLQKQQKQSVQVLQAEETFLQSQRHKVQTLEKELTKLREKQQTAQSEMFVLIKTEKQLESDLKQTKYRFDHQTEKQSQCLIKQEKLIPQIQELTAAVADKKKLMLEASEALDIQKERLAQLEDRIQEIESDIKQKQLSLDNFQQDIADGRARQKVLQRLRDEMEGFSAGSKRLLQETANSKSALYKKLRGLHEYVIPKDGAEAALAVILRPYAQTLVVETQQDLNEVLAFAKAQKIKDFSLLCLEHFFVEQNVDNPPFKCLKDSVIEHPLAEHLLRHIYYVEDIDQGIQLTKKCTGNSALTQDGTFVDAKNAIFFTAAVGDNNIFIREAELKLLEKKLPEMESGRLAVDSAIKNLLQQKQEMRFEKDALDKNIRSNEMKLIEINFGLQRMSGDLDKAANESAYLAKEINAVEGELQDLATKLQALTDQHAEAKAKGVHIQQRCSAINTELEDKSSALQQDRKLQQEKESTFQKAADENKKLMHALHVLDIKDQESHQQEQRLTEEIQLSKELQSQIKLKGGQVEQVLVEVEQALEEVTAACAKIEHEVTGHKLAIDTLEKDCAEARQTLKYVEEDLVRTSVQVAQVESASHAMAQEMQERHEMSIEAARAVVIGKDADFFSRSLEALEKNMRALRQEVENAGDINMTSIEEFDKYKSRYEFLNQQIDDLDLSKNELTQIITELDNEGRKIFKDTFSAIRHNFQKNFSILFNGGEADLQFTESSDVLEAGIEIIAKPPGKQMRSINLLSGGEKCLTAMALLFAIFEVKPAPFCILDEIDAPLDDSNVERFGNVVKQFIDKCQFIIITHNKRTMALADVIFGVSMEERGVSKVLSMELSTHDKPVATVLS